MKSLGMQIKHLVSLLKRLENQDSQCDINILKIC